MQSVSADARCMRQANANASMPAECTLLNTRTHTHAQAHTRARANTHDKQLERVTHAKYKIHLAHEARRCADTREAPSFSRVNRCTFMQSMQRDKLSSPSAAWLPRCCHHRHIYGCVLMLTRFHPAELGNSFHTPLLDRRSEEINRF